MKRSIAFTCVLILSVVSLAATAWKDLTVKPLKLQAGYGTVASITITPRSAQWDSGLNVGMPFNIEDSSVLYQTSTTGSAPENAAFGSGSGRLIADWFFLSNTPFSIGVKAEPLTHETDKNVKLTYSLAFDFTLGYTDSSDKRQQLKAFLIYDGNTENNYLWYPKSTSGNKLWPHEFKLTDKYVETDLTTGVIYDETYGCNIVDIKNLAKDIKTDSFIGSATGVVYFGFTKDSTDKITLDSASVPSGDYSAEVTVFLRTEQ